MTVRVTLTTASTITAMTRSRSGAMRRSRRRTTSPKFSERSTGIPTPKRVPEFTATRWPAAGISSCCRFLRPLPFGDAPLPAFAHRLHRAFSFAPRRYPSHAHPSPRAFATRRVTRLAHAHAVSIGHSLLAGLPGSLTLMPPLPRRTATRRSPGTSGRSRAAHGGCRDRRPRPSSSTRIWSARTMVETRCATTTVTASLVTGANAARSRASVARSRAENESSKR